MFEAARTGNTELLVAAVDAGLPVNILNEKGKRLSLQTISPSESELSGNSLLMLAAYG
jgi:hypothetical protein